MTIVFPEMVCIKARCASNFLGSSLVQVNTKIQNSKRTVLSFFFFGLSQTISWSLSFALWIDCYWKIQSFEKRKEKEMHRTSRNQEFAPPKEESLQISIQSWLLWNRGSSCSLGPSFSGMQVLFNWTWIEQIFTGGRLGALSPKGAPRFQLFLGLLFLIVSDLSVFLLLSERRLMIFFWWVKNM